MYSPMTVSLVGRTTTGSSSSLPPAMVTTASSGLKPSTCSASRVQVALGDEQREVGVLGAGRLDAGVDVGLHALPDGVAVGTDDHRAAHRSVVGQLRLGLDVLVPAREVVRLGGEHGSLGHRAAIVLPGADRPRSSCATAATRRRAQASSHRRRQCVHHDTERGVQVVAPPVVGHERRRSPRAPGAVAGHRVVGREVDGVGAPTTRRPGRPDRARPGRAAHRRRPSSRRRAPRRAGRHDPSRAIDATAAGPTRWPGPTPARRGRRRARRTGRPAGDARPSPATVRRAPRNRLTPRRHADHGAGARPRTEACRSTCTAGCRPGSSSTCRR